MQLQDDWAIPEIKCMYDALYVHKNKNVYRVHGDPELGGQGYLIGLHRCLSFKVIQRKINEQTVNAETG